MQMASAFRIINRKKVKAERLPSGKALFLTDEKKPGKGAETE